MTLKGDGKRTETLHKSFNTNLVLQCLRRILSLKTTICIFLILPTVAHESLKQVYFSS